MPQIFAYWAWFFDPELVPFVGFEHEKTRRMLLENSDPGDLFAVVGTSSPPTAKNDRGRLLGLREFGRELIDVTAFNDEYSLPEYMLRNDQPAWPYALPTLRAWALTPARLIRDIIGRQLRSSAITGVDRLSASEASSVLALNYFETAVKPVEAWAEVAARHTDAARLVIGRSGQPGPIPSEWSAAIARSDAPTFTYLLRFGMTDAWKIGISHSPEKRAVTLNFGVPSEVLGGDCWHVVDYHRFDNGGSAYQFEQALLCQLASYRTTCERVVASEEVVRRAWETRRLNQNVKKGGPIAGPAPSTHT